MIIKDQNSEGVEAHELQCENCKRKQRRSSDLADHIVSQFQSMGHQSLHDLSTFCERTVCASYLVFGGLFVSGGATP